MKAINERLSRNVLCTPANQSDVDRFQIDGVVRKGQQRLVIEVDLPSLRVSR